MFFEIDEYSFAVYRPHHVIWQAETTQIAMAKMTAGQNLSYIFEIKSDNHISATLLTKNNI